MGGDMNSDDDEGHLSGDDAEGLMHIYAFSIDNSTFNLLYVLTVKHLPEQSPPTNATITDSQNNTVLFIPATWRETTGQPGFKMGGDDMMNCTGGMCYSYAAAGYWPSVNPTLVDLVTRIVADPESYRGHVALPSGEDVSGEFELGM
ncbi:hypothetical protein CLOM_g5655 [Closterium sp. NIES-68]|nr:hypothetical protein CLOM_g5655 [Closterium sp. NIES-68]